MNELVRKALLGDKEAQEQCTLQGIALPCPKCYEDLVFENGFWRHPKNDCGFANLESKRLCVSLDLLEDWNTRPAPPIGRCGECRKFEVLYPEEAEAKLTQWAKEHPAKTLLQDFQEKYPDFDKDAVGNPRICPAWLGYKNYCCDSKKATYNQCTECWNQPVKEG